MTNKHLLQRWFPLPDGTRLRSPRFGRSRSIPETITVTALRSGQSLNWSSNELGVEVWIREKSGEVRVEVTATDLKMLGQAVSVVLKSVVEPGSPPASSDDLTEPDRGAIRKTVLFTTAATGGGCAGALNFGKLQEIELELGPRIAVDAFLLVNEQPPTDP